MRESPGRARVPRPREMGVERRDIGSEIKFV